MCGGWKRPEDIRGNKAGVGTRRVEAAATKPAPKAGWALLPGRGSLGPRVPLPPQRDAPSLPLQVAVPCLPATAWAPSGLCVPAGPTG